MDLTIPCPLCGETELVLNVEMTGGCKCWGMQDRCYCDSADSHIEISCRSSKKGRGRCAFSYNPPCGSDRDSIARLLVELLATAEGQAFQQMLVEGYDPKKKQKRYRW